MVSGKNWTAVCRNSSDAALTQILCSSLQYEIVYAAQAELARRSELVVLSYPNLDKWRMELRAGLRQPDTVDELWRTACGEATQQELDLLFSSGTRSPISPLHVDPELGF